MMQCILILSAWKPIECVGIYIKVFFSFSFLSLPLGPSLMCLLSSQRHLPKWHWSFSSPISRAQPQFLWHNVNKLLWFANVSNHLESDLAHITTSTNAARKMLSICSNAIKATVTRWYKRKMELWLDFDLKWMLRQEKNVHTHYDLVLVKAWLCALVVVAATCIAKNQCASLFLSINSWNSRFIMHIMHT